MQDTVDMLAVDSRGMTKIIGNLPLAVVYTVGLYVRNIFRKCVPVQIIFEKWRECVGSIVDGKNIHQPWRKENEKQSMTKTS